MYIVHVARPEVFDTANPKPQCQMKLLGLGPLCARGADQLRPSSWTMSVSTMACESTMYKLTPTKTQVYCTLKNSLADPAPSYAPRHPKETRKKRGFGREMNSCGTGRHTKD